MENRHTAPSEPADVTEPEIFYIVEEMPTFNGGEPIEFRRYIAQNLKYPQGAIDNGIAGKIFVRFIVTNKGKVVIPDQDAAAPEEKYIQMLKDEAIRVVSGSPDWTPGKQKGKTVNVLFTFPITFALQ